MSSERTSVETQLRIVTALRRAFERFKHHERFTRRVYPYIKEELDGYTVYVSIDPKHGHATIGVWGRDVPYADQVTLNFWLNTPERQAAWSEALAHEIDRIDPSDELERREQERARHPDLKLLATEAERLMAELAGVRECASQLIESLPVPASATLRASRCHWTRAQDETRAMFPSLFA